MVHLSSAFSLQVLAVLSAVGSTLSMRIDFREPINSRVHLSRRQSTIPVITQEQFQNQLSALCPSVFVDTGSSNIQTDISGLQVTVFGIENDLAEISQQVARLGVEGMDPDQQLASQWNSIGQLWANLEEESNSMVTTAVGVFQGFTSTLTANLFAFVSDGESSQAFEALQGFEATAENFASQAQAMANSFESLVQSVASFLSALPDGSNLVSIVSFTSNEFSEFSDIWTAMAIDTEFTTFVLLSLLTGNSGSPDPSVFWLTIEQMTCVYQTLVPALQTYATATS